MSILTLNTKALRIFKDLQKLLGQENVKHWSKKKNPNPSPIGDNERLYLTLPGELINLGGFVYIDLLDGYKIVKKGAKRNASVMLDTIKTILK